MKISLQRNETDAGSGEIVGRERYAHEIKEAKRVFTTFFRESMRKG